MDVRVSPEIPKSKNRLTHPDLSVYGRHGHLIGILVYRPGKYSTGYVFSPNGNGIVAATLRDISAKIEEADRAVEDGLL